MKNVLRRVKICIKFILAATLGRLLNIFYKFNCPLVLCYHGISNSTFNDINNITLEQFIYQVNLLKCLNYEFVSLSEFEKYLYLNKLNKKHCLITFDDAPSSFLRAARYLAKENIPFAVFICTRYANSENGYWCNWEIFKEIEEKMAVEFGSHSSNHHRMDKININDAFNDIMISFLEIKGKLKKTTNSFAFPYGKFSKELLSKLKENGIKPIFLTDVRKGDKYLANYCAFRRISVDYHDSKKSFLYKIKGYYRFL